MGFKPKLLEIFTSASTPSTKMFRPAANTFLRSAARMATQKRCMSEMAFTFAAPNAVHYTDADVKQIDVPSFSGSFGILPNHVPALAVLKPGVVTVFEKEGAAKKFFVSSGTITINDDSSVQILCEDLNGAVVVDGDGAGGDEELLGGALLLEHRHHAGLEDCECGDVVGEDAEAAGEGGDVDLLDVGVGVVHRVRRGEGERHLGHAALLRGHPGGRAQEGVCRRAEHLCGGGGRGCEDLQQLRLEAH